MESVPPATPPAIPAATTAVHARPADQEVLVVSHSNLFYWWPVWGVGFLMGILTLLDGHFLAVVPRGSTAITLPKEGSITRADGGAEPANGREVILLPPNTRVDMALDRLHTARSSGYGVFFATVLLLVIFITNVPLRGLWSVVVIVTIVLMSIIFALAGWWDTILSYINLLDIRINAGGYFFISGILFGIWVITMLVFDRQIYMIFTPGQLKVCTEIGGGERVFDTGGMKLEKQRSDLFRHWVLGLGSGDLIVRTSGAGQEHLELDNVLFIGQKAARIESLMKTKSVDAG